MRWRDATPSDYGAICSLHKQTEQLVGCAMALPEFNDPAILAWFLCEDDQGIAREAFYLERAIEVVGIGADARASMRVKTLAEKIFDRTRRAGIHNIFCDIPCHLTEKAGEVLRRLGFIDRSKEYTNFKVNL